MGVVTRANSRFYWLNLERPGQRPIRESTKIVCKGLTPKRLKENRALAEAIYHARMGDLARARHGIAVEKPRLTFGAYAVWYRDTITVTKRTAGRERSAIAVLVAALGAVPLDQIDRDRVREWMAERKKAVKAPTVNRELDVLKAMLTAAVPKYLAANPLFGLKRLRARAPEPQTLSYEQEAALLAVLEPRDRAVLICALDSLIRLGDLVALRWTQDKGTYFDIFDPKGAPYRPPISTRLRAALGGIERKGPRVFWWLHDQNAAIRWFASACHRAKVPHGRPHGVTFHSLRHTGATRFMRVPGATLRDLMAVGGWRDLKSVMRYVQPSPETRAVVDAMSRAQSVHTPPETR